MNELLPLIYKRDLQALARALQLSGAVNSLDPDGRTLLMHAVLADDPDPALIRFLIASGANVNARDSGQAWTALAFAARDQKSAIIKVLLEAGAEVDAQDIFGNTALWRAVMAGGNSDVVATLMKHGADSMLKNGNGVSPVDLAQRLGKQDVLKLMKAG